MSWKVMAAMPRLRFITGATTDAFEDGEVVRLPRNMRWFSWSGSPYQTITFQDGRHEQLCILQLSDGRFQQFGSRSMVFPKLKVLDLSGCCRLVQTPDFSHLPSLVKLVLDRCSSLVEVDRSIGHLKNLVNLSMKECVELKGLSAAFCKLTSLEFLDLCDCQKILVLPKQMGDLKSLRYLGLENTSISDIPDSIGKLQSLESLDLTCCSSLRKLPDSLGGLKSLSWLCLYGCKLLEQLPNSVRTLGSLEKLDIRNCESLTEIPNSLGHSKNVLELSLEGCISLENIPNSIKMSISGKDDHELKLNGLHSLRRLPDSLGNMDNMRRLSLRDCESLQELPDVIGRLMSLEDLDLAGCSSLRKIPESVGNLKRLMWFSLKNCRSIKELPESMGGLESLEVLHICGGVSVKKVPDFIGKLKNLQELHIRKIEDVSSHIGGLPRLAKMCIKDSPKLRFPPKLPPSLPYLKVQRCSAFEKFPGTSNLNKLKVLHLGGCKALHHSPGQWSFDSLKELILTASEGLSFNLMDELSKNSFEQLEFLFISGVIDGGSLLFRLPKGGQLNGLGAVFSLTGKPPSNASVITVCIQIKVEEKIITEGRWEAEKIDDVYFKKELERLGVEGKVLYAIEFGEQDEIFRYVKEGQVTLRVPTTYNDYQLTMAYFDLC